MAYEALAAWAGVTPEELSGGYRQMAEGARALQAKWREKVRAAGVEEAMRAMFAGMPYEEAVQRFNVANPGSLLNYWQTAQDQGLTLDGTSGILGQADAWDTAAAPPVNPLMQGRRYQWRPDGTLYDSLWGVSHSQDRITDDMRAEAGPPPGGAM